MQYLNDHGPNLLLVCFDKNINDYNLQEIANGSNEVLNVATRHLDNSTSNMFNITVQTS